MDITNKTNETKMILKIEFKLSQLFHSKLIFKDDC